MLENDGAHSRADVLSHEDLLRPRAEQKTATIHSQLRPESTANPLTMRRGDTDSAVSSWLDVEEEELSSSERVKRRWHAERPLSTAMAAFAGAGNGGTLGQRSTDDGPSGGATVATAAAGVVRTSYAVPSPVSTLVQEEREGLVLI